jgi:hypothetical protein
MYLATYFDANKSCRVYFEENKADENLQKWFKQDYTKVPFNKKFLPKIKKSFSKFKTSIRRAENGD